MMIKIRYIRPSSEHNIGTILYVKVQRALEKAIKSYMLLPRIKKKVLLKSK